MNSASRYSITAVTEDSRQLAERMRVQDESFDICNKRCNAIRDFLVEKHKCQESTMKLHELINTLSSTKQTIGTNVFCPAAENKELEKLRNENQVLTCILEEYQTAMDLVMTKYRSQIASTLYQQDISTSSKNSSTHDNYTQSGAPENDLASNLTEGLCKTELIMLVKNLYHQMQELSNVSEGSIQASAVLTSQMEERIHDLEVENENLRQLMHLNQDLVSSSSTSSLRELEEAPRTALGTTISNAPLSSTQRLLLLDEEQQANTTASKCLKMKPKRPNYKNDIEETFSS